MEDDHTNGEQIELFDKSQSDKLIALKPREKGLPATKNTDASASVFGWRFQIVVGIILSIKNISELKQVEIEGQTEDIELYFSSKDPEYIQVKAIQKNYLDAKDKQKAVLAMNTLINTSNRTKGKYSKLVYVANFRNPLNLSKALLEASWIPSMNLVFSRGYMELPDSAKKIVDSCIKAAQKQLKDGNYQNSITHFYLKDLYISTILFGSDDSSTDIDVLGGTLEIFFQKARVKVRDWQIVQVKKSLVDYYFANAGSSPKSDKHIMITKEKLFWRIVFEIIGNMTDDFEKDIPFTFCNEVEDYIDDFIQDQSQDINIINKVYAAVNDFFQNTNYVSSDIPNFITAKWKIFKNDFPLNEDPKVQEFGIKTLILKIISERRTVTKLKRIVNL